MALLLTFAAPVSADTSGSRPFRESGTFKSLESYSSECVPQRARTTCTETSLSAFSISPTEVVVCVSTYEYTYSERTGRGRFIGEESGCSEPVPSSTLNITQSRDQLTATLAPTDVTFYECDRRGCTETKTVTVSASDSGGPVQSFSSRGSFKDGTCTYRYSESGVSAPVTGTLTIDGVTLDESGWASQSQFKVQENCK